MIVGIGVDVCDIARFGRVLTRTPGVARRLFAESEREGLRVEQLAARFAAKEAVAKALGVRYAGGWSDVVVTRDADGPPSLAVSGRVAELATSRGITRWHLSMSHDGGIATAFVIAESVPPESVVAL